VTFLQRDLFIQMFNENLFFYKYYRFNSILKLNNFELLLDSR